MESYAEQPNSAPSHTDSLTRQLPRNQTVTIPGSQLKSNTHEHLKCSCFHHEPKHHGTHLVCKIIRKVDPWCDLLPSLPITEDASLVRLVTLCRGSALYPHYGIPGPAFPFRWTKAFRRNPPFVMHSPRPL